MRAASHGSSHASSARATTTAASTAIAPRGTPSVPVTSAVTTVAAASAAATVAGGLRDADEHQPRHAGPRPAGERQQPRIDGAPHVATRSLATRRRNTQYENAW